MIYPVLEKKKTNKNKGGRGCAGFRNSENLLTVVKELAIAWILCGRLHCLVVNPIIVDGGSGLRPIGFHLLWHTVEIAMSTRLCLL